MARPKSFAGLMFKNPWAWAGVVPFLAALVFSVAAILPARDALRLARNGADGVASVEEAYVRRQRGRFGVVSDFYHLRYSFANAGGRVRTGDDSVSVEFYRDAVVGGTLPVRYWRADGEVSELEPGGYFRDALMFLGIAGVSALLAGVGFGAAVRSARGLRRMARAGLRRSARVVAHVAPEGVRGASAVFHAHWVEPDGTTGRTYVGYPRDLPAVGSGITVLVDPAGRLPNVWEGDLGSG